VAANSVKNIIVPQLGIILLLESAVLVLAGTNQKQHEFKRVFRILSPHVVGERDFLSIFHLDVARYGRRAAFHPHSVDMDILERNFLERFPHLVHLLL
jgi:hypothetical protein